MSAVVAVIIVVLLTKKHRSSKRAYPVVGVQDGIGIQDGIGEQYCHTCLLVYMYEQGIKPKAVLVHSFCSAI